MKTLSERYKKPSARKVQIYNDLVKWAEELGAKKYGITSHNIYQFTFKIVTDNKTYIITKEHIYEHNA